MKGTVFMAMVAAALLALNAAAAPPPARGTPVRRDHVSPGPLPEEAVAVAAGINAFAFDLYPRLRQGNENVFFSPFSISTALAMTYAGARGETADQMARVLHFTQPPDRLHPATRALIEDVNARREAGKCELVTANALWGQKGFTFLPAFLETTRTNYGGGLIELDYARDPEAARGTINRWVEEKTNNKIRDLIARGVLGRDTRLVLTNAIYFLGAWEVEFKPADTREAPFTLADGKKVQAPLMSRRGEFRYMETETFQGLAMDYAASDLSMVVLLPRGPIGIEALEKQLSAATLTDLLGRMRTCPGNVWVPRFQTTREADLGETLAAMGMADLFNEKADLSGMDGKRDLVVSNVIHKAFVDVNEKGTEAAAATAVDIAPTAIMEPEQPFEFRADHPFVFLIRDNRSGCILFLGRLMQP